MSTMNIKPQDLLLHSWEVSQAWRWPLAHIPIIFYSNDAEDYDDDDADDDDDNDDDDETPLLSLSSYPG